MQVVCKNGRNGNSRCGLDTRGAGDPGGDARVGAQAGQLSTWGASIPIDGAAVIFGAGCVVAVAPRCTLFGLLCRSAEPRVAGRGAMMAFVDRSCSGLRWVAKCSCPLSRCWRKWQTDWLATITVLGGSGVGCSQQAVSHGPRKSKRCGRWRARQQSVASPPALGCCAQHTMVASRQRSYGMDRVS